MSTKSGSWYIPGEGKKPVGPFTGEQVIESLRAGRLTERTLCWQEGMAKWLPLAEVEPFAASIRPVAAPRKGGLFRRLVIRSVLLAGIAALGVVLYVYWQEATVIGKAKSLIAAGDCEEAAELLRSFQQDTYLYRYSHEPGYLLALSATREYARRRTPRAFQRSRWRSREDDSKTCSAPMNDGGSKRRWTSPASSPLFRGRPPTISREP